MKAKNGAKKAWVDDMLATWDGTDECITFPFPPNSAGYPIVRVNGREVLASRYVLEHTAGPPPTAGHVAAHAPIKCHQPRCLNPSHLRWATRQENTADRLLDGTHGQGGNNRVNHPHTLTPDAVREILASGDGNRDLAERYGVLPETIRKIRRGERWTWLLEAGAA